MIKYSDFTKYRYKLKESITYQTDIFDARIETKYISLHTDGLLIVKTGYAWDGATFCPDFKSIMRASLVHDCLCQMINVGLLGKWCQQKADKILKVICIEDGMNTWLANLVYGCVRVYQWGQHARR